MENGKGEDNSLHVYQEGLVRQLAHGVILNLHVAPTSLARLTGKATKQLKSPFIMASTYIHVYMYMYITHSNQFWQLNVPSHDSYVVSQPSVVDPLVCIPCHESLNHGLLPL